MSTIKKRRVGVGDTESPAEGANTTHKYEGEGDGELIAINKSHIDELMNNSRIQTESMKSMMQMMKGMQDKMNNMRGEIKHLSDKCEHIETSINTIQKTQTTANSSRLVGVDDKLNCLGDRLTNMEDKQNYHEVLLKNQKWEYKVPRPSQAFWNQIDDPGQREAAEDFLHQIKEYTTKMRTGYNGDCDGGCSISLDITRRLLYSPVFRPHWREFWNALEEYQYCLKCLPDDDKDSYLRLCEVDLPNNVLGFLSNALKSTHFHHFHLRNNNFGQNGIDFALKYIQTNPILEQFVLIENPMEREGFTRLCQIIKTHPSIHSLELDNCIGDDIDGYEALQMVMIAGRSKLKCVDINNLDISTEGDAYISDFLASNPILETLRLTSNRLDDIDAMAIANALKHNTNLRILDIRYNEDMTNSGWIALRKAEFDDTSLNAAADSNHTCCIGYPDDAYEKGLDTVEMNGDDPYESTDGFFDPNYVRQKKIYHLLCSRNRNCSNVDYFEDVPVELLPDMLISIQQYSNYHGPDHTPSQDIRDVCPLSIWYEILQRWDKCLATFEALSL